MWGPSFPIHPFTLSFFLRVPTSPCVFLVTPLTTVVFHESPKTIAPSCNQLASRQEEWKWKWAGGVIISCCSCTVYCFICLRVQIELLFSSFIYRPLNCLKKSQRSTEHKQTLLFFILVKVKPLDLAGFGFSEPPPTMIVDPCVCISNVVELCLRAGIHDCTASPNNPCDHKITGYREIPFHNALRASKLISCDLIDRGIIPSTLVKDKYMAILRVLLVGPVLWNNLPPNIRNKESLSTFKSTLKIHLFKRPRWRKIVLFPWPWKL